MSMNFEKIPSPIYPAYLKVGGYSIALEPELIESLKEAAKKDPGQLLEMILQKVGTNRYLKEMIQEGWEKSEDKVSLANQLQDELQRL